MLARELLLEVPGPLDLRGVELSRTGRHRDVIPRVIAERRTETDLLRQIRAQPALLEELADRKKVVCSWWERSWEMASGDNTPGPSSKVSATRGFCVPPQKIGWSSEMSLRTSAEGGPVGPLVRPAIGVGVIGVDDAPSLSDPLPWSLPRAEPVDRAGCTVAPEGIAATMIARVASAATTTTNVRRRSMKCGASVPSTIWGHGVQREQRL